MSIDRRIDKKYVIHIYSGILAFKKSEILPFPATWMDLEIIILREVSQRETNIIWYACIRSLKIWYKWTYLQKRNRVTDLENELVVTSGEGLRVRDRLGLWDWHMHTAIFKIDNQQRPTVYHREFCSIFCNNLNGKRTWR